MPLQDDSQKVEKVAILAKRMLHLHDIFANPLGRANALTPEELKTIANIPESILEAIARKIDAGTGNDGTIDNKYYRPAEKLLNILLAPAVEDYELKDARAFEEALWKFEKEHGDYLELLPLCTDNTHTIASHLSDFATLYSLFGKHLQVSRVSEDRTDRYVMGFDAKEANKTWRDWQETRPMRLQLQNVYGTASNVKIMEKFLSGILQPEEWLNDADIDAVLKVFGLSQQVHRLPFKAEDMGLALHFEREKHAKDDPKATYYIPFILNLGTDEHSRSIHKGAITRDFPFGLIHKLIRRLFQQNITIR